MDTQTREQLSRSLNCSTYRRGNSGSTIEAFKTSALIYKMQFGFIHKNLTELFSMTLKPPSQLGHTAVQRNEEEKDMDIRLQKCNFF